jgi:PAS domain S-box-containing protein
MKLRDGETRVWARDLASVALALSGSEGAHVFVHPRAVPLAECGRELTPADRAAVAEIIAAAPNVQRRFIPIDLPSGRPARMRAIASGSKPRRTAGWLVLSGDGDTLDAGRDGLRSVIELAAAAAEREEQGELPSKLALMRAAVESFDEYAVVLLDSDGVIVASSRAAERDLRLRSQEVVGRSIVDFVEEAPIWLEEARYSGEFRTRTEVTGGDGEKVDAFVSMRLLRDGAGEERGFSYVAIPA